MEAVCACGGISAAGLDDAAQFVVAYHCRACQQRSGSPFGAFITPVPVVPILSLCERSRLDWVGLSGAAGHHPLGSPA